MFLCAMRTTSSTSKDHVHVVGYKNIQNAEMIVDPNSNQSECEQDFEDQQDISKNVKKQTSKYIGVSWYKHGKKWRAQLKHKGQNYYGGYFDNEKHAAMEVNLLCDKYGKKRQNLMIDIELDAIQQAPNTTSIYTGVTWNRNKKCWQVQLQHNKKAYFGGYFDHEKHAAMKVNLLCDKFEKERKNPMIAIELNLIQRTPNQTSIYTGVFWDKKDKKWQAKIMHKGKCYFGGYSDIEEHAAMKINLLCDKIKIERKNPMINIDLDKIQKVPKKASIYTGVYWNKGCKKWQAQLKNKGKNYCEYFDIEEHAAMKVNLICDKLEIKRKNPEINIDAIQKKKSKMYQSTAEIIVNPEVKIEDENILNRFKDECENRFIQDNNDKEKCIATEFENSNAKRKRKDNSILSDDIKKEKMEIDPLEKI